VQVLKEVATDERFKIWLFRGKVGFDVRQRFLEAEQGKWVAGRCP
jgi:hypothetical protein